MLMACYFSDIITGSVAYAGGDGHLYTIEDHPTYKRGCTGLDAPIHLLFVHDPIVSCMPALQLHSPPATSSSTPPPAAPARPPPAPARNAASPPPARRHQLQPAGKSARAGWTPARWD